MRSRKPNELLKAALRSSSGDWGEAFREQFASQESLPDDAGNHQCLNRVDVSTLTCVRRVSVSTEGACPLAFISFVACFVCFQH